jgi:putative ABC transport system substrate-binding protein
MRRREFITLLGGAAAYPLAARAQQSDRMPRIGVLMFARESDPEGQACLAAFLQGLRSLGWAEGPNVRIEIRWTRDDDTKKSLENTRRSAKELVALKPDVILASGTLNFRALQAATQTVPIVFVLPIDPAEFGYVTSLTRPGGNATGFTYAHMKGADLYANLWAHLYASRGTPLQLLKELAPAIHTVATLRKPFIPEAIGNFAIWQYRGQLQWVQQSHFNLLDAKELERAVETFARSTNGALTVVPGAITAVYRDILVTLAARHRLPALYSHRMFVTGGGLASYGPNWLDPHQVVAGYVDRILKGEKPADMPVLTTTKFEFAINLKTAKDLGLTVPPTLLARADEVIE